MDKRKAYALARPVLALIDLVPGHTKRVEHRYEVTVFCDGVEWCARVEFIGYHFRPIPVRSLQSATIDRLENLGVETLVQANCGDGRIDIVRHGACAVDARRRMTDAEIEAIKPDLRAMIAESL